MRRRLLALGRVLLFWFGTMAILAATGPGAAALGDRSGLLTGAIASFLTLGFTLLFVRWERKSLHDFGVYVTRRSPYLFFLGILIGLALVGAHTALTALVAPVHWVIDRHSAPPRAMLMVITFLLLATREELAFRGYPLRKLAADLNPWAAQLIVAALFAIEHMIGGANWSNALFGAGMGSLVFGMAALATRGLAMPIGLHAAYNIATAYALMKRPAEALRFLEKVAKEGMPCYPLFEGDPWLDGLRKNPEFTAFMKRVKAQWETLRSTT